MPMHITLTSCSTSLILAVYKHPPAVAYLLAKSTFYRALDAHRVTYSNSTAPCRSVLKLAHLRKEAAALLITD